MKDYTNYDDLSDDEEYKISRDTLDGLKEKLGGKIIERRDDDGELDFIYLKFTRNDRHWRIVLNPDWGTPELHVRIHNTSGNLAINYNNEIDPGNFTIDPVWDDIDKKTEKLFLSPGIYIDEYMDELSGMVKLLGELSENFIEEVTDFISENNVEYMLYDATIIEVRFRDDILKRDYINTIPSSLEMLEKHSKLFESGNRKVDPKPKVYISGKPAQTKSIKGVTVCSYCNATVLLKGSGRCSNCGAPT